MTLGIGRNSLKEAGFTLIEVLAAFAVLLSGLTLVAAAFTRHLAAVQLLEDSLDAGRWADQRLIQETLRRELNVQRAHEDLLPAGVASELTFRSSRPDQDPLKELVIEEGTAQVSWVRRSQQRSTQLTTGFVASAGGKNSS